MFSVPLVLSHPHLQAIVGSDNWSFVIDRGNVDVGYTWQTVLTDFCLVGHYCEAVLFSFTAIMNVGDVLPLHLEAKTERFHRFNSEEPFTLMLVSWNSFQFKQSLT